MKFGLVCLILSVVFVARSEQGLLGTGAGAVSGVVGFKDTVGQTVVDTGLKATLGDSRLGQNLRTSNYAAWDATASAFQAPSNAVAGTPITGIHSKPPAGYTKAKYH